MHNPLTFAQMLAVRAQFADGARPSAIAAALKLPVRTVRWMCLGVHVRNRQGLQVRGSDETSGDRFRRAQVLKSLRQEVLDAR